MFDPFDTIGYTPRWKCGDWSAFHGWTHIAADIAIWVPTPRS